MDIQTEYEACMKELDKLVVPYTDFDGTPMQHFRTGAEDVYRRMDELEELMALRKRVNVMDWECSQYGCSATNEEINAYHEYASMEQPQ